MPTPGEGDRDLFLTADNGALDDGADAEGFMLDTVPAFELGFFARSGLGSLFGRAFDGRVLAAGRPVGLMPRLALPPELLLALDVA